MHAKNLHLADGPRNRMSIAAVVIAVLLSFLITSTAGAAIPETNFKAGAYRGTLQVVTTVPDVGTTKTVLKIAGRSAGSSTLEFLGTPQPAQPLILSGDDYPVRLFSLRPEIVGMALEEVKNVDAQNNSTFMGLTSLTVSGGVVIAEVTQTYAFGGKQVTVTIRIRLVRVSA